MTPESVLIELLERVGVAQDNTVLVAEDEVSRWPSVAISALKAHKLIRKTRPATSVVCPGCEEECVMPVNTIVAPAGELALFVVCDKRNDINRVSIPINSLEQWQISGTAIADLLAELLGLHRPITDQITAGRWEVGLLKGKKHSSHIVLLAGDTLNLTLAGHSIALADVLTLKGDQFAIDKKTLTRFIDNPVTGGGDIESAEQRRVRVKKRVNELKAQGVRAFLKTVAKEENLSITRIKQLIQDDNRAPKPNTSNW